MKRAIISVSDKTGVVDFAKGLADLGYDIISTGGTAKELESNGIKVTKVSDITEFPECFDGRVKTLHPKIHGGILNIRDNKDHQQQKSELEIDDIDLVCINLYPFKQTVESGADFSECIENIDIGGPAMIRSAAKNFKYVTVVTDPKDYKDVLDKLQNNSMKESDRLELALKAFELTSYYDSMITNYLRNYVEGHEFPEYLTLGFEKLYDLRYGENPHQKASFYQDLSNEKGNLVQAEQLQGKELSYNNINDTNGALNILKEYKDEPTIVVVKHANPCAICSEENVYKAFKKAYEADDTSIFGGIIASNQVIDKDTADMMKDIFLEVIVAPDFTDEALEILKQKPNLRLLKLDDINNVEEGRDFKSVRGGMLIMDRDIDLIDDLTVVTNREPTEKEMEDLLFAWKAVKNTTSNAISLAKDKVLIANGPGQVNRVWPTENCITHAGEKAKGAVLASDAFFPFNDCATLAAEAGITAIIQPGGSIRDQDSIDVCNENDIAMVFTGMRHFKHS